MRVLEDIGLGLVSFLLFIALLLLVLAFTLNLTVLNPQFMGTAIGKLDVPSLAKGIAAERLPPEDSAYLPAINDTIEEVKPWINQQTAYLVSGTYDYLLGKTNTFNLAISTDPLRSSLVNNMIQAFMKSPPPEYLQLSAADQKRYAAQLQQEYADSIPATVVVDQYFIGRDAMQALQQVKAIFGYIHTAYFGLIGLCVVLILLTILILRQAKGVTRSLGIVLLISGAISLLASFLLNKALLSAIPLQELPGSVRSWLPVFISDLMNPYKILSLATLIIGIILLVLSLVVIHHRSAPSSPPAPAS